MTDGDRNGGALAAVPSGALAESVSRDRASYLIQVRRELEENPEARDTVASSEPAAEARDELIRILSTTRPGRDYPVAKPGTDDLLEEAVDQVLTELESQRRSPAALYVVDGSTGELIMPLPEGGVYRPPDYIDEAGEVKKARPIVHPGITSSLALARADGSRKAEMVRRCQGDPVAALAIEHLTGPQKMLARVEEKLKERGVSVSRIPEEEEPEEEVEFGREHVSGVFQSPNLSFHRSMMFPDLLAAKLLAMCGSGGGVKIGKIREADNGKQRWYRLGVTVRRPDRIQ